MRPASFLVLVALFACGGATTTEESPPSGEATEDLGPYGYRSRLAWCRAYASCTARDDDDAKACAGAPEDAPLMTSAHYARCATLASELACDAPKDTGAWVHTRIACGH